jgi:hypothetical protein
MPAEKERAHDTPYAFEVVAVRTEMVGGHEHVIAVKLADGRMQTKAFVIGMIEQHAAHYTMRPPEGAPAYAAHQETGLPLLLQVRLCPDCGEKTLFA